MISSRAGRLRAFMAVLCTLIGVLLCLRGFYSLLTDTPLKVASLMFELSTFTFIIVFVLKKGHSILWDFCNNVLLFAFVSGAITVITWTPFVTWTPFIWTPLGNCNWDIMGLPILTFGWYALTFGWAICSLSVGISCLFKKTDQ